MTQKTSPDDASSMTHSVACLRRLHAALNAHDLDALTACFASDYQSTFPAHLDRGFQGHGPLRTNWAQIFRAVPDLHAELLALAVDDETAWAEWEWTGTRVDGEPFWQRGVAIQGVRDERIVWVRLYMEPVQAAAGAVDAASALQLPRPEL